MLRKAQRRRVRRQIVRSRLLAGATAAAIALGLVAGGAAAAAANPNASLSTPVVVSGGVTTYDQNGLVCSAAIVGYEKPAALDGSNLNGDGVYTANWGTISWDVSERTVTWDIVPGWDIDVCVKGGTYLSTIDTTVSTSSSYTHSYAGLSHLGFRVNSSQPTNDLTCDIATNYPGRALTNGDHINMEIVRGGVTSQVNAQIDIRQAQDPASESGLVARVTAPGGPYTLPITIEQKNSGVFAFEYSTYLTGSYTVTWVQFNSTYFNQDRDSSMFLVCGDLPTDELVTPTARMVDLTCDTDGSYTLDDVEGIRWFIGTTEVRPGTYAVSAASAVTVRAEAIGPDYALEPDAQAEWTFGFTEPADCVLPCLPASAVSYTYYTASTANMTNPANSGLITVTAREGYSAELCDDFWVVAAAWNYTSSTSIWPQTLRSTDPAGDHLQGYVSSVGTYFYHAPVACGQGDVYASFTGMPYVGPELFGPNNPFSETFLHNMGFTGPNPTYFNTAPGCNVVNPIAPIANPIVECGTYGSIDISDVANPYIGYTVYRGAAGANGSVEGLEAVNLVDATEGVFTVVATPLGGYIVAPNTVRQWQFDLGEYYDCPVDVDLRLTYMEECAPDATYTFRIRNAESTSVPYTFTVSGNSALNGSGIAAPGDTFFDLDVPRTNPAQSYTVTLNWGDGTSILAESTTKASGRDKVCSLTVAPVVDITCTIDGRYTVPSVLGVVWSVDGETRTPGTYTVDAAASLVLRATAADGYVLYQGGQLSSTRDFTLTFTEPENCDLPELPVTNALIAFLEPTCELGQQLDTANFVVDDAELARYAPELSSVNGSTYAVVFVITDDEAVFFDSDTPPAGRTVSDSGKTLTFTGTLQGPDRSEDCVTTVVLQNPVSFVDSCLEGASFTITRVEGVVYTVYVNDDEPFVVVWNDGEATRTYPVNEGDTVRVVPSPASDRYTISPDPAPFERTFAVYEGDCLPTLPLTEGSAEFMPASCLDATNWVVLDSIEGVQWWVNDEAVNPGTWPMAIGDVVVTATPLPGHGFPLEAQTRWEFTAVVVDPDCLPTLAFTGATGALVGLGAASLLLMFAGLGVVMLRRQRA